MHWASTATSTSSTSGRARATRRSQPHAAAHASSRRTLTPELLDVGRARSQRRGSTSIGRSPTPSALLSRRFLRRRDVVRRGDVRAAPRVAADELRPRLPSGRADRPHQLDAGRLHRGAVHDHEAIRPAPPPGASAPPLWGSPSHVRELFGADVDVSGTTERLRVDRFATGGVFDFFKTTYGPTIAAYRNIADDHERASHIPTGPSPSWRSAISPAGSWNGNTCWSSATLRR